MRYDKAWGWWLAFGLVSGLPAWAAAAQDASAAAQTETETDSETDTQDAAPPIETDAADDDAEDAEPRTSLFADGVEQAAQLATAKRLEDELASLLGPDGLPVELGPGPVRDALKDVAIRCDLLAHSSGEPAALEVLIASQARVYNALVQDASAHGESVEVARGLGQLRVAAHRLSDLETPDAAAAGAYWLMLADLIDANRTIADPADRRVFVRELLSRYVEDFGGEPEEEGNEAGPADTQGYLLDARVALARLLDEAGQQQAAYDALGPLAEVGEDDVRYAQVRPVVAHYELIGTEVALELPTAAGRDWRLADTPGQPVLIHIFAQGVGDSDDSIAALRRAIARARLGGYSVVSLHVGELIPDRALPPWPTAVVAPERRQLLDTLGVDAVPMYVWIDHAGRVASVGKTLDVVRRFPEPPEADVVEGSAEDAADLDTTNPDAAGDTSP
ncbi:hypothetical protein OT109_13235 [Phycisphaeraceae bacterium D3-23]